MAVTVENYVTSHEPPKLILLIDDDPHFRRIARNVLEANGFLVIEAENGRQGIRMYRDLCPILVITEVLMPEFDGIETLRGIRQENSAATVLAISKHDPLGFDYLRLIKNLGANDTLDKSWNPDALIAIVRRNLS